MGINSKDLRKGIKRLGERPGFAPRPVVMLETGAPEDVEALVKQAQSSLDEAVRLANASAKKLGIIEASEDERFLAENSRKQAEDLRVAAENMRKAAEIIRIENEQLRQGSETARGNAEQTRNTAEAARVLAEEARAASAAAQAVAEQTRVLDENSRKSAEQTRQSNEASRVSAESARSSAEEARAAAATATASAEALRVAAENARVAAETLRAAAESTRQSTFETNEAARASAYTAAETNRDSAYTTAENARDAAFAAKEATRDAANEAALNCAETLAALGPKCDQNTANIANLQQEIDEIEPIVINGDVTNAPDEEDVTTDSNNLLKLKDRPTAVNQKGYKILRKGVSLATQMTDTNTIYEVRYAFDMNSSTLNIPSGCALKFNGGRISNGIINGSNTCIEAEKTIIFGENLIIGGSWLVEFIYTDWFFINNTTLSNILALNNASVHTDVYVNHALNAIPSDFNGYAVLSYTHIHLNASITKTGGAANNSIIGVTDSHNVVIEGGTINGNKTSFNTDSEYGFGICIYGSSYNVSVRNVEIKDCRGDGIYVLSSVSPSNINIVDCNIHGCRRQGISVICVDTFAIKNCTISNISGAAPQACIDFEPNYDTQNIRNGVIDNCNFSSSDKGVAFANNCGGALENISVLNCVFDFSNFSSAIVFVKCNTISICNCRFSLDNLLSTYALLSENTNNITVDKCVFECNLGANKILFALGRNATITGCIVTTTDCIFTSSAIVLYNCIVSATQLGELRSNSRLVGNVINITEGNLSLRDGAENIIMENNQITINDVSSRCFGASNAKNVKIRNNKLVLGSSGSSAQLVFFATCENVDFSYNELVLKTNKNMMQMNVTNGSFVGNIVEFDVDYSQTVFIAGSSSSLLDVRDNKFIELSEYSFTGSKYSGINTKTSVLNNVGDTIYDNDKPIYWNGTSWVDSGGEKYDISNRGTVSSSPVANKIGFMHLAVDASYHAIENISGVMTSGKDLLAGTTFKAGVSYKFFYHRDSVTSTGSINLYNSSGGGRIIIAGGTTNDLSATYIPTTDLVNYKVTLLSGTTSQINYSAKIEEGITKPSYNIGGQEYIEADGEVAGIARSGTFANAPTPTNVGFQYFCTSGASIDGGTTEKTNIVIYYTGSGWVDANGNAVVATT